MQPKERKPRGSAARAKAKITKQAQLQSDVELDGEEDDDYENSSMHADASQESGLPGTRNNSNQPSFEVNGPSTQNDQIGAEKDCDAFGDDESVSGGELTNRNEAHALVDYGLFVHAAFVLILTHFAAFSQYSGSGINRVDSRSSGIFSIASDMVY